MAAAAAAAAASASLCRRSAGLSSLLRSPFSAVAAHSDPPASTAPSTLSAFQCAIHSESDPDRIVELFQSSASLPRFHAHRPIFALTVKKLARARRTDLIDRVLSSFLSDPKAPKSEGFIMRLITLYSSARMPDQAAAAFERIPDFLGRPRTEKSLSALLNAYLENRRYNLVVETFDRAEKEFSISPGVVSYNILLQALCQKGDVENARKAFAGMHEKGIKPNIISCNALLNGYMTEGDGAGFDEILMEIRSKGLEPNVVTYNCRISKFCGDSETFKAAELLDVMVAKGIQPNLMTFSTIIDGFTTEGDVGSALKIYKRMKVMKRMIGKEGVSPDSIIYGVLLRALVQNEQFGDALPICKDCLNNMLAPPFEVVKGLINGLMKESRVDDAKYVVSKMRTVTKADAADAWKKLECDLSLQAMS